MQCGVLFQQIEFGKDQGRRASSGIDLLISSQLGRRSLDIHFRRYHAERSEDYAAFRNVLFTLQRHLPLAGESDLLPHLDYCYERSIDCVGLVKVG
jgi:hypothetical protein